jgi:glycosyltransferase involved in cell wall biosynthesis
MVVDGENGLLAAGPEAFEDALERLLGDAGLRARLGAAARATVEACYAVPVVAPRLAALLLKAAGG